MSRPSAAILVNDFESLRGNGDGVSFAFAFASNYRCGQRPFIGALSLSLTRPELTAGAPLSFFRLWHGGTTVGLVRRVLGPHL